MCVCVMGGGGLSRTKNLKKYIKLKWNFQRGAVLGKNPFHVGGMDYFWNHLMRVNVVTIVSNEWL